MTQCIKVQKQININRLDHRSNTDRGTLVNRSEKQ